MLIVGDGPSGRKIAVCVEAKVDETFSGKRIGQYWESKKSSSKPTRAPERIEALLNIVFGDSARPNIRPWKSLRYQLLAAAAGTAIEACARGAGIGVFVVHELRTDRANDKKLAANDQDLQAFAGALFGGEPEGFAPGRLYGPVHLPAGKSLSRDINLLLGKATFDWNQSAP